MADNLSMDERRRCMRAVRAIDTTPELAIRSLVHRMGFRYKLHCGSLPGKPDMVFPSRGKIIFVHGCFWHRHNCSRGRKVPVTNTGYWTEKLERNLNRDKQNLSALRKAGWKVLVVWECSLRDISRLSARIGTFLAD